MQSHIAAGANLSVGAKPIMFEEFGKKLNSDQQTEWMIQQLRDPIYQSTYASVEKAIDNKQPIAGSMFWKLAIPVFNGQVSSVLPTWFLTQQMVHGLKAQGP